jgi:anti-anti-sigma factor
MSNVHVVNFTGDLDLSARTLITNKLKCIEHFPPRSITIVDLMDVTYIDSTFFNALARIQNLAFHGFPRGRICIALQNAYYRRLFQITEFDRAFPIFKNVDAAREYADVQSRFPDPHY